MRQIFFILVFFGLGASAQATERYTVFEKIAVLPVALTDARNREEAWWQIREALVAQRLVKVASRRLMVNRGVFEPREKLNPADAIILARILEADLLILPSVSESQFVFRAYDGDAGDLLLEHSFAFNQELSVNEQIVAIAQMAVKSFLAELPYHGAQVKDRNSESLFGKFEDGSQVVFVSAKPDLGVQVGDKVEWILMEAGLKPKVIYDLGVVRAIQGEQLEVLVPAGFPEKYLKDRAAVRFPRLVSMEESSQNRNAMPGVEFLRTSLTPAAPSKAKEQRPAANKLNWILNAAAFVLLAF